MVPAAGGRFSAARVALARSGKHREAGIDHCLDEGQSFTLSRFPWCGVWMRGTSALDDDGIAVG